jgi:hypothetical protein
MQIDPVQEWQRLTAEYRQKGEVELRELARDYADLTPAAQEVLRSEMRSRGLDDPASTRSAPPLQSAPGEPTQAPLALKNAPWAGSPVDMAFGAIGARAPELVPDTPDTGDEIDGPHEYTWKTLLCECETSDQARQLIEALKQAGIDSWAEGTGLTSRYAMSRRNYSRVLVAADQLDQARAIAANSIPQEIVDESKEKVPDFVEPKCPKCGSDDVVLEGVDPANTWRCEQCDEQWTETSPATEGAGPTG